MGRGRSSSGRGSSSSRGFSSSSRSRSSSSLRSRNWGSSHTIVIIGGNRVYHSGSGSSSGGGAKAVLIIMAILFIFIGICTMMVGCDNISESNRYGQVQAEAIDNTLMGGYYYTTYEYTINGTDYTSMSNEGWEYPEVVGKYVNIYYLKSNPNVITELEQESSPIPLIIGIVFTGLGATFLIIAIKMKSSKDKDEAPISEIGTYSTSKPQVETTVRCPYCGTKHDKNLSSCPNCGAGEK